MVDEYGVLSVGFEKNMGNKKCFFIKASRNLSLRCFMNFMLVYLCWVSVWVSLTCLHAGLHVTFFGEYFECCALMFVQFQNNKVSLFPFSYASLMISLMEKNSSYLLVTVLYDPNKHKGENFALFMFWFCINKNCVNIYLIYSRISLSFFNKHGLQTWSAYAWKRRNSVRPWSVFPYYNFYYMLKFSFYYIIVIILITNSQKIDFLLLLISPA